MESMEDIEGYAYANERDRRVREGGTEQDNESFSEVSNPSELDFDEKDYVSLDFSSLEHPKDTKDEEEKKASEGNVLTKVRLKSLTEKLTQQITTKMLKRFLLAFSSAVRIEDSEKEKKVIIPNTSIFQSLMVFAFQSIPSLLSQYLKSTQSAIDLAKLQKNIHLLKNYVSNYILFLNKLSDREMIEFIISNAMPLASFLLYLKPYHVKLVKLVIKIWAESSGSLQLHAFLFIRDIAKENERDVRVPELYSYMLKKCYKEYSENARLMGWKNYDAIQLMRNCYVELAGINLVVSYQQAFSHIRKLCLDLRNAMKEALVSVVLIVDERKCEENI
eukprot:TRINITY_DN6082_c0_g1_i7.p1 TRINITY_DN6082_c0_g1~~TRINITY_DN6082_c0_g1_i7.p1  ORF type:complete len:333 (-),score=98.64 TRINITY_DN6082_c0_g1_i7:856-1854(-)